MSSRLYLLIPFFVLREKVLLFLPEIQAITIDLQIHCAQQ